MNCNPYQCYISTDYLSWGISNVTALYSDEYFINVENDTATATATATASFPNAARNVPNAIYFFNDFCMETIFVVAMFLFVVIYSMNMCELMKGYHHDIHLCNAKRFSFHEQLLLELKHELDELKQSTQSIQSIQSNNFDKSVKSCKKEFNKKYKQLVLIIETLYNDIEYMNKRVDKLSSQVSIAEENIHSIKQNCKESREEQYQNAFTNVPISQHMLFSSKLKPKNC